MPNTQEKENTPASPSVIRGSVIVDACTLSLLSCDIPSKHRLAGGSGRHALLHNYLEILPFLSRHGYEILIPAMVAFEAARTLPNGINIALLGDNYNPKASLKAFMKEVFCGQHPNIKIVSDPDNPLEQGLYKLAESIASQQSLEKSSGCRSDSRVSPDKWKNAIRGKIQHYLRFLTEGAGDLVIEGLACRDHGSFVLSDDHKLRNNCSSKAGILNTGGLLLGLQNQQLLPFLGINASAREIFTYVQEQEMDSEYQLVKSLIDNGSLAGSRNDYAFQGALSGLAGELMHDEASLKSADTVTADNPNAASARIDKFRARYPQWRSKGKDGDTLGLS